MPYCAHCGAYIPDGQTTCLSCGYEPESEKKAEAAAAAAKAETEELRKQLEEQRRKNQEQSRKWAEEQQKRREEQARQEQERAEQQRKNREWAEKEYARRQKENEARAQSYVNRPSSTGTAANNSSAQSSKLMAGLSYLGLLFLVPKFLAPQDEFAQYHSRQGMRLFIFSLIADFLGGTLGGIGWIASLARLFFIYKGITNVVNGQEEPLPYIGTLGDNNN